MVTINFSNDEINLMCIYNTGTRAGMLDELASMREYLEFSETELRGLTDAVMDKLERMSDAAFDELDLFPDFDGWGK